MVDTDCVLSEVRVDNEETADGLKVTIKHDKLNVLSREEQNTLLLRYGGNLEGQ